MSYSINNLAKVFIYHMVVIRRNNFWLYLYDFVISIDTSPFPTAEGNSVSFVESLTHGICDSPMEINVSLNLLTKACDCYGKSGSLLLDIGDLDIMISINRWLKQITNEIHANRNTVNRYMGSIYFKFMCSMACGSKVINRLVRIQHNRNCEFMMRTSNANIFRVTSLFCGEFAGNRWITCTKASDAELSCFLWS